MSSSANKWSEALEFLTNRRADRAALRKNGLILAASGTILSAFLAFLFRDNLMGNEPRLVYTTCLGALSGVMLSFLVSHVAGQESIRLPSLLGQVSLASFLGVLYGFFALEAGAFYKVNVATMEPDDVNSLSIKLAVVGVGVGALLGPASKRVLEDLRRTAKL